MTKTMTAQAALDRLQTLYDQSVSNLRSAVGTFLRTGERADPEARAQGLFAYPELSVSWFGDRPDNLAPRAYARLSRPGVYSTTITRPDASSKNRSGVSPQASPVGRLRAAP